MYISIIGILWKISAFALHAIFLVEYSIMNTTSGKLITTVEGCMEYSPEATFNKKSLSGICITTIAKMSDVA